MDNKPVTPPDEVPEVSAARARIAVQRLINSHFHNDNRARCSIPADRENDDDLIAMDYVNQTAERIGRAEQQVAALTAQLKAMTEDRDLWQGEHNNDCPNESLVAALTAERDGLLNRHIEFMVTGGPVGMASDYDALKAENAALKARAEQAEARCERLESENGRLLNDASVWRNRAINAEEELAGTNRLAARAKEQSYE